MPRTINYERINAKLLNSKRVQDAMRGKMESKFNEAKEELIKEFLDHKVSREILSPDAGNISNTLDGKDNKSLFGFIGFEAGSEPVLDVAGILENETRLSKEAKVTGKRMEFKVFHPSLRELYQRTPMPWESGRSWLYGITHGISGFGYFLAGMFQNLAKSRSGQGIQVENEVRTGSYRPPPEGYIEKMIAKFRAKFGAGTN